MDGRRATDGRLEQVIETSVEAFVAMNVDGAITAWNGAAERAFGMSRDEVLGRQLADTIVPPQHRAAHHAGIARFLSTGKRHLLDRRVEITAWHRDGHQFPVEIAVWAVDEGDGRWTFNAFIHDITERRAMQDALLLAYEKEREAALLLRELDEEKREFVTTVSHELRTPLTNVIGYLEVLSNGDLGELTQPQLRNLAVVERNTARLHRLIEDLLTLSRVEAGAFHLVLDPVDLAELVGAVHETMEPLARHRSHELVLDCPATMPYVADGMQLQRALVNLVTNAVNYTTDGGRIALTVHRIGSAVEISVRDNGIGINPREVPRLFNRFFRGAFAVREAVQGAGLGLAIAKTIVEGHGGEISVETTLGAGTTFTVRLPYPPPGTG